MFCAFQNIAKPQFFFVQCPLAFCLSKWHCKIYFVWRWFLQQEIKKATKKFENRQLEFQYSAICQTVIWWNFIRETAWAEKSQLIFTLKHNVKIWHLSQVYYAFWLPIIQIICLFLPTVSQSVAAGIRTAHFTHSSYQQTCLNSISLSQLIIWNLRLWNSDNYKWSSKLHGNIIPNI